MRAMILYFIMLLSAGFCVFYAVKNRKMTVLFFRTMRLSRHIYYTVIFVSGFLLGLKITGKAFDFLYLISGIILINILFAASLAVNNINDRNIDRINTKDNILNSGGLALRHYRFLFFFLAVVSLALSLAISLKVFFITIAIHFFSWIYSSPPLHLKKVFILNTALIAFSTLLAMVLGFTAAGDSIRLFPASLAATVLAVLTLSFNTKDVNDFKGDKKYGVKTLVTVFGQKKGRIITAMLAFAGYLLVPVLLNAYTLLIPSAIFGAVTYAVINSKAKQINEPLIFALFFAYAAVFVFINPVVR